MIPGSYAGNMMKDAAVYLKTLYAFVISPRAFKEDDRKWHQLFLETGTGKSEGNAAKLGSILLRFDGYSSGLTEVEQAALLEDGEGAKGNGK